MDTVNCEQCGAAIPRTTRFCPECGHANAAALATGPVSESSNEGHAVEAVFPARMDPTPPAIPGTGPVGGAPTVNITNTPAPVPASQGQPTQYIPSGQTSYAPSYAPPPTQNFAQPQVPVPYAASQPPAQGYSSYSQSPMGYQYQQQVGVAGVAPRDSTVSLLLELIGYVGFLGIGHIYANRVGRGIGLMIAWWVYWGMITALFVTILLSPIACLMLIVGIAIPILSGVWIKSDVDKENAYARRGY